MKYLIHLSAMLPLALIGGCVATSNYTSPYQDPVSCIGDCVNGQGAYTGPNGYKYIGEYNDGSKHGQGTYTYADGRVIEGTWENNVFQYVHKKPPGIV